MIDEENRSSFDRLVAGLSTQERSAMLKEINASMQSSIEFVDTETSEQETKLSLHLKYKDESFFYKFFLWLRSLLEKKTAEQVYSDDVIASMAHKISRNHPGLINHKMFSLDSFFYDRLKALKESADFFKPYLVFMDDNPGEFYVFLSSFLAQDFVNEVNRRADPFTLDFNVEATSEVKATLLKALDDVLKDMDTGTKNNLYSAVSSVTWLYHFTRLPFIHFTAQFTNIVGENYTCPYKNAALDYEAFASVFTNVRSVPNEVLESLFLFSQRGRLSSNVQQKDIERAVKEFLAKANGALLPIQAFISSVPVVKIGKIVNDNYDWMPQTLEGAEAWFAPFRAQWRKVIEVRWNDWVRAQKKNSLGVSLLYDFGISEFPVMEYRPWQNLWIRVPFTYELSGGFLSWFVTNVYDEMLSVFNDVMLEGIFISNETREAYSEALNLFSQSGSQMKTLLQNLSPSGDYAAAFEEITNNQMMTFKAQNSIDSLMATIESDIKDVSTKFMKCGKVLETILSEILDDNERHSHDVLQNLRTIKGHNNRQWREELLEEKERFKKSLYYLVELDVIDSTNRVS